MRKLMLLATMLAMVLAMMALSAVPAFAAQNNNNGVRVDCTNNQTQTTTTMSNQNSRLCNDIGNNRGGNQENESSGNNNVRVDCTNNQTQIVAILSNQNSRLCNNIGNNRGNNQENESSGNNQNNGSVPVVIQAPAETFVSGSNTINAGSVTTSGNNSNTCAAQQNFNNSGGLLNQQQVQQTNSESGGIIFTGSTFNNAPTQTVTCNPSVEQSAAASSN